MKTYSDILLSVRNLLRSNGVEGYAQESRYIVSKASGKTVSDLLRDGRLYTTNAVCDAAMDMAERRIKGEPVAYLTGSWEFYGLPMIVSSDVLIPRMDTEVIVDTAIEILRGNKMDARILDLCTGSGCITCAIAKNLPATRFVAVDISARALEICRQNLDALRLSTHVTTMQADATSSPPFGLGEFDMIVSNPPYISTLDLMALDPSVRDYEPIWALDGGEDGLKFYRGIIKYWKVLLRRGGYVLFEVGENQAEDVMEMLLSGGFSEVDTRKDTLGVDRVVIGRY